MERPTPQSVTNDLILRDVVEDDLAIFFVQQGDPDANYMAAFTTKDPTDRVAFISHWSRILTDPTVIIKTIMVAGHVVGYVTSYEEAGEPEVSYWIGKDYWGQGVATRALAQFLDIANPRRPIYARVAKDNHGSLRVLQKCGFRVVGEGTGFANARGQNVEEYLLTLQAQ